MDQIQFNPVAPTNLVKALTSIAQAEQKNVHFSIPDKASLTALATSVNGDIRGAINALQFACLQGECFAREQALVCNRPKSGRLQGLNASVFFSESGRSSDLSKVFEGASSLVSSSSKSGKRKRNNNSISSKLEPLKLASIGGKDPSLDLFHAIGKVLYCKRTDFAEAARLPASLKNKSRKELIINPEELLENVPISQDGFIAFLHENYTDFCCDIKDLSVAADNLSKSDPFFHEWTVSSISYQHHRLT